MSIGRLLAAGKSLAGGHAEGGRFRVNKQVQLPKFGSARNPFASAPTPVVSEPMTRAVAEAQVTAPVVTPTVERPGRNVDFAAPKKVADLVARAPKVVGARAARAIRWVGEWGHKLNPLTLMAKRPGPVRLVKNNFSQPAVQTELSLDAVKVVRNDLSDVDLDVVLVKRSVEPDAKEQLVMASAGGEAPAPGTLNRVTEWVFGPKF